jgi:hypothetical protein
VQLQSFVPGQVKVLPQLSVKYDPEQTVTAVFGSQVQLPQTASEKHELPMQQLPASVSAGESHMMQAFGTQEPLLHEL